MSTDAQAENVTHKCRKADAKVNVLTQRKERPFATWASHALLLQRRSGQSGNSLECPVSQRHSQPSTQQSDSNLQQLAH